MLNWWSEWYYGLSKYCSRGVSRSTACPWRLSSAWPKVILQRRRCKVCSTFLKSTIFCPMRTHINKRPSPCPSQAWHRSVCKISPPCAAWLRSLSHTHAKCNFRLLYKMTKRTITYKKKALWRICTSPSFKKKRRRFHIDLGPLWRSSSPADLWAGEGETQLG